MSPRAIAQLSFLFFPLRQVSRLGLMPVPSLLHLLLSEIMETEIWVERLESR